LGGLSKKAYQVEQHRNSTTPVLNLDAGNLLFRNKPLPGQEYQSRANAEGIVNAYNLMAYDGVGVGGLDLAGGLAFLEFLAERSSFPWLSANLTRKSSGKRVFRAYHIRQVGSIAVGIIGLTGSKAAEYLTTDDAVILPWQEVLPKFVAELVRSCDMIILLSDNALQANEEIAQAVPDIDLIMQASAMAGNLPAMQVGNSLVTQTGRQGKFLGRLTIVWSKSGIWGTDTYRNAFTPLDTDLPDHPQVMKIVEETKARVNKPGNLVQDFTGDGRAIPPFVGWNTCAGCHEKQAAFWQTTRHAGAYRTLVAARQEYNIDCLPCHVTFLRINSDTPESLRTKLPQLPASMQQVGCEMCHGAGEKHVGTGDGRSITRLAGESTCRTCHTPARNDDFNYGEYLKKICCPANK